MQELQLRDFLKELFSRKIMVCISVIISIIVCAGIGYYRFQHTQTGDQRAKIDTYEKSMKSFDEAIKSIETNITMTQEQIDKLQKYIDNALFLKLDSNNIQVAEICYLIETDLEESEKIKGLTGIYRDVVDLGTISYEIKKALPDYENLFFDNIFEFKQYGNYIRIGVHHYDSTEANKLLEVVQKVIETTKETISISHNLTMVKKKQYVMASNWFRVEQVKVQNDLKWNKNALDDFKRKYADFQNSKLFYERNNKPVTFVAVSPIKTIIKYSVFGLFLGLVWPILWIFYKKVIE